jgi:hypothetical protein
MLMTAHCILMYNTVYLFLLCRLKINHMKKLLNMFILGPLSMVANTRVLVLHCYPIPKYIFPEMH